MKNMTDESKFESMRPYRDEEIPAAMQRIADSTFFPLLASYVFPESDLATVKEAVKAIRTTDQFQAQVMYHVNAQVIRRTMTEFTYGGIGHLSPSERYLFIGNHRDIVLDSSLMQYVLFQNGHETSEITFGANLMQNQLIIDIGKANKMFKVERPGTDMRQFYQSSLRLSEYIRHTICHKHRSVWIAQRNGRTKDGKDSTDQGIIKMLGMSGGRNKADAIARLRIAPVAISYEWEPCDILKTLELYEKQKAGCYVKKPGEDVNSILTGFAQAKGRVHMEFCEPLKEDELAAIDPSAPGGFNRAVANLIDRRICKAYRLFPNNYIAHDMRSGKREFASLYTRAQEAAFENRLKTLEQYRENCDTAILSNILTGIYANPVDQAQG